MELIKLEQPVSVFDTVVQSGEEKKDPERSETHFPYSVTQIARRKREFFNRSVFSINRTDTQARRVEKHFCSS